MTLHRSRTVSPQKKTLYNRGHGKGAVDGFLGHIRSLSDEVAQDKPVWDADNYAVRLQAMADARACSGATYSFVIDYFNVMVVFAFGFGRNKQHTFQRIHAHGAQP